MSTANGRTRVLLVDHNRDRVAFLEHILRQREFDVAAAESPASARNLLAAQPFSFVLVEKAGIGLAVDIVTRRLPIRPVIFASGSLSEEENEICRRHDLHVFEKQFAAIDLIAHLDGIRGQ